MVCCLNGQCDNPQLPDNTKHCTKCGIPLIKLDNRYLPLKCLGQGGFGKTYLAKDTKNFDELCVIKQFLPQAQGSYAFKYCQDKFQEEALCLKNLGKHNCIPGLLAYFEENQQLYLVQEFIDGQTLTDVVKSQGVFSESQVKAFLQEMLLLLKFVHENKVLHRDIKPDNIMQRKGDGKFVLIDFGVSKEFQQVVTLQRGTVIGSFGYAPMEQMKAGMAYPASDLFSLGVTCFYLLTRIEPSELFLAEGYGWANSWQQHLPNSLSGGLANVIDKMLAQNHWKRHQSVEEALQDLLSQKTPAIPLASLAPTKIIR